jgi:phosphonoacetaldehyde hydrolase
MTFGFSRAYRGPLKGVILDWAGTTVDYGCYAPLVVFIEVFKKHGVTVTTEQARVPMGMHKREHIRQMTLMPEVQRKWLEVHQRVPSDADVEAMFADFVPMQLAVLNQHADVIPGVLGAIEHFRSRGLKIGTTTGFTRQMMEIVSSVAKKQGYEADALVCSNEVPAGRPEPWMCFEVAKQLGIYPMESMVKIGDTRVDIEEGLNAGMWTIGVAKTGNEVGLTEAEIAALTPSEREPKIKKAYETLLTAGAHYVVDGVADVPPLLAQIEQRLSAGEKP